MTGAAVTATQATTALPLVGDIPAQDEQPRRRRRWPLVVPLLTVIALIAGVAGWWLAVGRYDSVPNVIGLDQTHAAASLRDHGFKVIWIDPVFSDGVKKSLVAQENPHSGSHVRDGSTITLALSKGVEMVRVPDVRKFKPAVAAATLEQAKLHVGDTSYDWSTTVHKGLVIRTRPAAGTTIPHDKDVEIVVSKGPHPLTVPDVAGKTFDDANALLTSVGFSVFRVDRFNDEVEPGNVISQNPPANTTSHDGATVTLVVSKGPHLFKVPDVTGKKIDDAIKIIEHAGFKADPNEIFPFGPGKVVRETPTGMQPKGTTIELDYY